MKTLVHLRLLRFLTIKEPVLDSLARWFSCEAMKLASVAIEFRHTFYTVSHQCKDTQISGPQ